RKRSMLLSMLPYLRNSTVQARASGTRMPLVMALIAALSLLVGCGAPVAEFRRYETYAYKVGPAQDIKFTEDQRREIDLAMQALFGTPDAPVMPIREGVDVGKLMNVSRLALAAGPVGRDEQGNPRGLYREHCAHCHGI